eukprot:SM000120S25688  [mRNA]  locus=s120:147613:149373:+ [translate_table: standard]
MFRWPHPHFETGRYARRDVFLGDREYGLALDCLTKACTDLLVCDGDGDACKVLLGKRVVEPQPSWWYMGGRMKPGEAPEQSISRLVLRELQLDVAPGRFRPLGTHSYAWERRQQAPQENGTCDITAVFTLVLEGDEAFRIRMDDKEYSQFGWFNLKEMIEGDFHPALKASARDLLARHAWDRLVSTVEKDADARDIVAAARQLVGLR